jgi:H/ACA ribonucleoprotein complex subunit 1
VTRGSDNWSDADPQVYFTVKMDSGMVAGSFKKEDKVYIGGDKLLPIERFLPKPKIPGQKPESKSKAYFG